MIVGVAFTVCLLLVPQAAASDRIEAARALERSGDYAAAEKLYRDALDADPRDIRLWNSLGVTLNRQDRFVEAAKAFRAAANLAPSVPGLQLNLGIALFRAGDYAAAARALEPIRKNEQASELLAMSYAGMNDYARAIPLLEELATTSTDPAVHIALATCYAAVKRDSDVERTMAHMFKVVPDSPALHMALGDAYAKRDQNAEAVTEYRKAAELDGAMTGALLEAGRLLWKQGKYDEAEPLLTAELKRSPASADARYYLGTLYLYRDGPAKAMPYLEAYVKSRPEQKNGYFELGKALIRSQRLDEGIAVLEKAVSLAPEDGNWRYVLAQAYRSAGRESDARREIEISKALSSVGGSKGSTK